MDYKVGQVLYMTSSKSLKIIPIQVIEEVCRTTLKGTEKSFIIQLPDENKTTANRLATLFFDFKPKLPNV